jgi:hypothetical protein
MFIVHAYAVNLKREMIWLLWLITISMNALSDGLLRLN